MDVRFSACQTVLITVPEQPIPIQHYLRQSHRLVKALAASSQIESLGNDLYRLKMRSMTFLALTIQPIVDLRVWADPTGCVHVQSMGCEVRGVDYINQRFQLDLKGRLYPSTENRKSVLKGQADLAVSVALPPALWLTPKPLLEKAGNGLLRSVLATIKQRLVHHLVSDYQQWWKAQVQVPVQAMEAVQAESLLSINPPVS